MKPHERIALLKTNVIAIAESAAAQNEIRLEEVNEEYRRDLDDRIQDMENSPDQFANLFNPISDKMAIAVERGDTDYCLRLNTFPCDNFSDLELRVLLALMFEVFTLREETSEDPLTKERLYDMTPLAERIQITWS